MIRGDGVVEGLKLVSLPGLKVTGLLAFRQPRAHEHCRGKGRENARGNSRLGLLANRTS
jgi:hypothetical protein